MRHPQHLGGLAWRQIDWTRKSLIRHVFASRCDNEKKLSDMELKYNVKS